MTTTNPDKDNAEQTRVNCDLLMETSTMPLEKVLELVHANCVEYFTEVDELGDALELLSTTENFIAESYKGNSNAEVQDRVVGGRLYASIEALTTAGDGSSCRCSSAFERSRNRFLSALLR